MYSWIDKERIGLWGWSYGGYATAMALTKDTSNVFTCGISVAPVTSWLYYGQSLYFIINSHRIFLHIQYDSYL